MYFNVNTISDITNFSGKQIRPVLLEKREVKGNIFDSKLQWPIQQIPSISFIIDGRFTCDR
jgi:hypothetical protein